MFTEPRLQLGPPPLPPPYWLLYLLHSILYCGGGQRRRGGVSQRGRRGILFSPSKSPSRPSRGRTDGRTAQRFSPAEEEKEQRRRSSHEIDTVCVKRGRSGVRFRCSNMLFSAFLLSLQCHLGLYFSLLGLIPSPLFVGVLKLKVMTLILCNHMIYSRN